MTTHRNDDLGVTYVWCGSHYTARFDGGGGECVVTRSYERSYCGLPAPDGTPRDRYHLPLYEAAELAMRRVVGAAPTGRRVLDVACGSGYGTRYLRAQGWDAVGMDIDGEAVRFAVCADLEGTYWHTERPDGRFDAIVSVETIEHIEADASALAGWAAHVAPGAPVVLSTPNLRVNGRHLSEYHVREYHPEQLRWLVERAGLEVVEHVASVEASPRHQMIVAVAR